MAMYFFFWTQRHILSLSKSVICHLSLRAQYTMLEDKIWCLGMVLCMPSVSFCVEQFTVFKHRRFFIHTWLKLKFTVRNTPRYISKHYTFTRWSSYGEIYAYECYNGRSFLANRPFPLYGCIVRTSSEHRKKGDSLLSVSIMHMCSYCNHAQKLCHHSNFFFFNNDGLFFKYLKVFKHSCIQWDVERNRALSSLHGLVIVMFLQSFEHKKKPCYLSVWYWRTMSSVNGYAHDLSNTEY